MGERPTLHLTNASSRRLHGPGRVWTIMARPRTWERGIGRVAALSPIVALTPLMQAAIAERKAGIDGGPALAVYRSAFDARLAIMDLRPGHIHGYLWEGMGSGTLLESGDTLICACSRAEAAAGRCHRSWCAPALVAAGWRVILDGVDTASK